VVARVARILPGYGVAGVWNAELRTMWREQLRMQSRNQQHHTAGSSLRHRQGHLSA
jgi:hypothetical protein